LSFSSEITTHRMTFNIGFYFDHVFFQVFLHFEQYTKALMPSSPLRVCLI